VCVREQRAGGRGRRAEEGGAEGPRRPGARGRRRRGLVGGRAQPRALLERVERSSKLSSSPADGTRRLKVRLSIAEPSVDSRGLSRKVRLEGSLHGGSCTILTLSPEATKPGGKADRAADRDEVLVAGIDALIQKLEAAAPKISDDATCFSTGK
jgi:hypothetical protein